MTDEKIEQQIEKLTNAVNVWEPPARLAGVTKEAAILNARVAESSSSAMMKAAALVAEALDRNTAASNATGRKMVWLTLAYVLLTLALLVTAWYQPR